MKRGILLAVAGVVALVAAEDIGTPPTTGKQCNCPAPQPGPEGKQGPQGKPGERGPAGQDG